LYRSKGGNFQLLRHWVYYRENIGSRYCFLCYVSCATLSQLPLVLGKHLRPGQHIDLVGAYKKDMREADDEVMQKASIFVDTFGGIEESGDLSIPLEKGILKEVDIKGDFGKS